MSRNLSLPPESNLSNGGSNRTIPSFRFTVLYNCRPTWDDSPHPQMVDFILGDGSSLSVDNPCTKCEPWLAFRCERCWKPVHLLLDSSSAPRAKRRKYSPWTAASCYDLQRRAATDGRQTKDMEKEQLFIYSVTINGQLWETCYGKVWETSAARIN